MLNWFDLHFNFAVMLFGLFWSLCLSSSSLLIVRADRWFMFGTCLMSCLIIELVFPHHFCDGCVYRLLYWHELFRVRLGCTANSVFAEVFQCEWFVQNTLFNYLWFVIWFKFRASAVIIANAVVLYSLICRMVWSSALTSCLIWY